MGRSEVLTLDSGHDSIRQLLDATVQISSAGERAVGMVEVAEVNTGSGVQSPANKKVFSVNSYHASRQLSIFGPYVPIAH